MMRFKGKTAIITGGGSGIGRATAERLRDEGARVFTVQRGLDDNFESISIDLCKPEAPQQIIDQVVSKTGQIDVLINNAGMMMEARVEDTSLDDWSKTIALNLTAPFLMIKAALPFLRKTRGSIVNTGSIEGLGSNAMHAAYGASKSGLHGLTRAVAVDHGHEGIRCNAVAPGWINTGLNNDFIESMNDPEAFRRDLGKIHPVGRAGDPQEVAAVIAFLASDDASFITGQVYIVDGGRMTKLSLP
jgi:meso-butanediol dehydrogenase/(S,S)-butanediol dehydrogenase/diacetyl reductase